ncbi:translocation/assembly module TamB domain-containing protein [Phenylobacterium sp.]|uniref:translocation/assembly module TamB domain-containing protein n=1 Tax=Phenylobacterium sp. TaxID=1871053 RepID=UPI0037838851
MSAPADKPEDAPETSPVLRRSAAPKAIVAACLAVLVLLAAILAGARYGVLLPQTRLLIEARTDGLKIGRVGRLKLEGLSGDIWRDFQVRRLTIRDEKGVWLEAHNVSLQWRYAELFRRRFYADQIQAQSIRILRRPTLTPKGKDRGLPVSFQIERGNAGVEMLPAFSGRRGVYDLDFTLDIERRGGRRGQLHATSLLHPGDLLDVEFDLSKNRPLHLRADALEAQGGALAGALGLAVDQPFSLRLRAEGRTAQGRFDAIARSGALTPLEASGAWTPDGGRAQGRLRLAASRLTTRWSARLGPEIGFDLSGRKAQKDLYALDAALRADNLSLRAQGLGDLGRRQIGPRGLTVTATSAALSRMTGGPQMGAARVQGVLTGRGGDYRFAGTGVVSRLQLGGYGLAQISGPLEIEADNGEYRLEADIAGRGGTGGGWIAAMMGGAPRASLEAARLADGRLSLRDLRIDGRGLDVDATGSRGLLGGLNFKGKAQVSNLAAARPGAAGGATATWSAQQSAAGRAWVVEVDARGQGFATGYAELDRLLGPKPRLTGQASLQGRRIAVARAAVDGAALDASTAGVLGADGRLQFKVDWSAAGPFRAGPVEIAGKIRGGGALTGALNAPRADLTAQVDEIDLPRLPLRNARITLSFLRRPDGSSGAVAIAADSQQGPARARSDFRFRDGGIDLANLSADAGGLRADGSLSLRRRTPSAADLRIAMGPGAFLDAGSVSGTVRIVDAPGGARADLDLAAANARIRGFAPLIGRARLSAQGPLDRLPYAAEAEGRSRAESWGFAGRGVITGSGGVRAATFDGTARLGARDLRTVETAVFRMEPGGRTARLRLASADGGRIDVDCRLSGGAADIQARVARLGLGLFDVDLAGDIEGVVRLQGQGEALAGVIDARLSGARGRGAPASSGLDATVRGRLAGSTLNLEATAANGDGLKASAALTLPAEASAAPFRLAVARRRPMQGRFSAEGEVRPLWDLLVGGERSLSGQVSTSGTLGGTLASPRATGGLQMTGGRFDDGPTGLSLRQVTLRADFSESAVNVTRAEGADGHGGEVSGAGRISLAPDGVSTFRLDLRRFRLIDNDQATASASGPVTIDRGADGRVRLAGNLTIDRADVAADLPIPSGVVAMDVVERNRPPALDAGLPPPVRRGSGWALDVRLTAPGRVFLRGRGLDVELALNARVQGTTSRPQLGGTARIVRGDYDFAGKRFEFDDEGEVSLSTRPEEIRLNLSATREDPTLIAVVRIRGTAARPEVTLTSTPSLPNDEVLSQVLFGRSASQLSPVEAAQLASAISALASGGGFDVIGNLRNFAGLDRLAFAGGGDTAMTVAGGKYLTDDVYLEIIGGGREGSAAQVEWRVRRNLSILSRLTGQGGTRLAVRWRRDY